MMPSETRRSVLAPVALALALLCAIAAGASGLGYRSGLWGLGIGFGVLQWAAYAAMAVCVLALVAAILTRPGRGRHGFAAALLALLIAAPTFAYPAWMLDRAKRLPNIHDISTDTDNPPQYIAVLPARANAPNSSQYGGAAIAVQQHQAYPGVVPLETSSPMDVTFSRALAVARDMGFEIVATDPAAGRIEATDTTRWFGFKDDIIIRITPRPGGSRVDVRSTSRIGSSDVGANARRIERYLGKLSRAS